MRLALRSLALKQHRRRTPGLVCIRSQRVCCMSAEGARPSGAAVCVHAPTATDLQAARQALEAGPLVARRATAEEPEQHCALCYPDAAPSGTADGAASAGPCGAFSPPHFFSALVSRVMGRVLLTAGSTHSTQVVVQENIAALPDGLVFVADKQLGGKGRGGNRWESPGGCLMFSACKRLALPGQRLPFVQYLVSLAVVQAVQAEAAQRLQGATIPVRIKWPNDLYAGQFKLGGILCHSSYRGGEFHVIMGVGLNLSNRQPTTCVDELIVQAAAARAAAAGAAASAAAAAGPAAEQGQQQQQQQGHSGGGSPPAPVSREALLAGILSRLEPMLERLAAEGFEPFEAEYCRHWLHSEQEVLLEEGGCHIPVTIRGLSPSGYLLASDGAGERYELHPDGNSLDFFQGLVRKKMPAQQ